MGEYDGLNLIKGEIVLFDISKVEKVPQIGWNSVNFIEQDNFLVQGIPNESYYYFVHSFYGIPEDKDKILGLPTYDDIEYCSMVMNNNTIATQFHPEKSSKYGINMYENFVLFCKR